MELKKIAETYKQETRKRELNMKNGRMISSTPSIINLLVGEWRNLRELG